MADADQCGVTYTLPNLLVLAFAAAHFVAMFAWSNLGLILAVHGAEFLGSTESRPFFGKHGTFSDSEFDDFAFTGGNALMTAHARPI